MVSGIGEEGRGDVAAEASPSAQAATNSDEEQHAERDARARDRLEGAGHVPDCESGSHSSGWVERRVSGSSSHRRAACPSPGLRPLTGRRQTYLMKLVSMMPAMSGTCLMMPISSSRSAASLEKACSSPAKNFWFAALSCQRRYLAELPNCSPRLLHVGAHDLVGLGLLLADHLDRLEVAVGQRLRRLGVLGEELRACSRRCP